MKGRISDFGFEISEARLELKWCARYWVAGAHQNVQSRTKRSTSHIKKRVGLLTGGMRMADTAIVKYCVEVCEPRLESWSNALCYGASMAHVRIRSLQFPGPAIPRPEAAVDLDDQWGCM